MPRRDVTDELRHNVLVDIPKGQRGIIRLDPANSYALQDAAQAHRDLEARKTTGSVVLVM